MRALHSALLTWNDGARGLRPAFYYSTDLRPRVRPALLRPPQPRRRHQPLAHRHRRRARTTSTRGFTVEPTRPAIPSASSSTCIFDRRARPALQRPRQPHLLGGAREPLPDERARDARSALRLRPQPWLGFYATFGSGAQALRQRRPHRRRSRHLLRLRHRDHPGLRPTAPPSCAPAPASSLDLRHDVARASAGLLVQALVRLHARHRRRRSPPTSGCAALVGRADQPVGAHARAVAAGGDVRSPGRTTAAHSRSPSCRRSGGPDDLRGFRFQDFRDY